MNFHYQSLWTVQGFWKKGGCVKITLEKIKSILSVKILKEEKVDIKTLSKEEGT